MGDDSGGSVEKVVTALELERVTREGWMVVERFDQDEPVPLTREELPPPRDTSSAYSGGGYYPTLNHNNGSVTLNRTGLARQSFFRVRRDRSAIIVELQDDLKTSRKEASEALKSVEEQRKNVSKWQGELSAEKEVTKRQREVVDGLRSQINEANAAKAKLEGDIGKLREHIGRKTFEEILPPPPPKSA